MRHKDTFGVLVMAVLVVLALAMVFTSTGDPAAASSGAWWDQAWIGVIVVGLGAPLMLSTFAGPRGGCMVALALALLGGVAFYMYFVRGL